MLAETAQFTSATTSPVITEEYVCFGDAPVAQIDGATTRWTHADHLGTPQKQTDLPGAVQWQAEYQPYGTIETLRKNDVHQPLRFPGQVAEQFDAGPNGVTERSFNNARWYRPNWGRYVQPDELLITPVVDVFAYAHERPLSLTDPTGLASGGGPYHAPDGVKTKCRKDDSCPVLRGKIWLLGKIIASHTGWDWNVPPPRGGGRHANESDVF